MSIRTKEDLSDFLSDDISWRKKELTSMRFLVEKQQNPIRLSSTIRSGIILMYAHWEGFVKSASRAYFEYISRRHFNFSQITNNLKAFYIMKHINKTNENCMQFYIELCDKLDQNNNNKYEIKYKNLYLSSKNIDYSYLQEFIISLGFEEQLFLTKKQFLNAQLIDKRNRIAHGEKISIDTNDYCEYHDNTIQLLDLFRNCVENSIIQRHYLAKSP